MPSIPHSDVSADIDALLNGFALQRIRRFFHQKHWNEESALATAADEAEPGLKLENVAAHSWHVADAVMILAGHFPDLDEARCIQLALLHDRLEAFTGDYDPVGTDGQGTGTHAFNTDAQLQKQREERAARDAYLASLRPVLAQEQRPLLDDIIDVASPEAHFVMAVDKLQALAYVLEKKQGAMTPEHLAFTIRYSGKAVEYFPGLNDHYDELIRRLSSRTEKRLRW